MTPLPHCTARRHPISFPFTGVSLTLSTSTHAPTAAAAGDGATAAPTGTAGGRTLTLTEQEVKEAMQYSATAGLPSLLTRLMSLQRGEHKPPPSTPLSLLVSNGSQHALSSVFEVLLHDGPDAAPVIVEEPTYSGSLAFLHGLGTPMVGVATDGHGLRPDDLAALLDGWDVAERKRPRPRVLYTIPTGGNPTGASSTIERKAAVYAIARRHGLLILEDDPYRYLQYGGAGEDGTSGGGRVPSYLSLDVDGRVVRFDSLSKVSEKGGGGSVGRGDTGACSWCTDASVPPSPLPPPAGAVGWRACWVCDGAAGHRGSRQHAAPVLRPPPQRPVTSRRRQAAG